MSGWVCFSGGTAEWAFEMEVCPQGTFSTKSQGDSEFGRDAATGRWLFRRDGDAWELPVFSQLEGPFGCYLHNPIRDHNTHPRGPSAQSTAVAQITPLISGGGNGGTGFPRAMYSTNGYVRMSI